MGEALDGKPEELGELMSNVAVTVQPSLAQPASLGLYQGVPLTSRSSFYAGALPDRITIYRRAICAVCSSESERGAQRGMDRFRPSLRVRWQPVTRGCRRLR